jgi:hypothetical protein
MEIALGDLTLEEINLTISNYLKYRWKKNYNKKE